MDTSIGFLLLIQLILIALNAVFACAEIAVLSINETKLEKMASQGHKGARRIQRLTQDPARFLATIQVAITLSGFLGSAFAADNFSDPLVAWLVSLGVPIPASTLNTIAVIVITLILSYVTLIFGELVPKRVAMKKPEDLAFGISGLVNGIAVLFRPIVSLLSASTNLVLRLMGIDPTQEDEEVGEEDIRMMVDAGSEQGTIDEEEKEFIQNIFEFDDLTAEEIATHRTEVTILWQEDSIQDWAQTIHDSRHTLYPVCHVSPDNVIGILNAKDYFRLEDKSRESIMVNAVKPAYFVPATIKADVLFRNMRAKGYSMSIVVDEHGGMVGIVTLNDLIEELLGDLNEEDSAADQDEPRILPQEEGVWTILGNVTLDDLEEELEIELDCEDFDTFTGLVFDQIGQVPPDGEQNICLTYGRLEICVKQIEDHQIAKATVRLLEKEPAQDEE